MGHVGFSVDRCLGVNEFKLHYLFICLLILRGLWHIDLCRLFNANSIFIQTIQFSITVLDCQTPFSFKLFRLVKQFYIQTIQFSISTRFNSIWLIDRTLSGATTSARVHQGTMAIKRYSAFLKASALLEPNHQIV